MDETSDDEQIDENTASTADAGEESSEDDGTTPSAGTVELLAYLDAQYGDRFDAERRENLRDRIDDTLEAGETLRDVDLANGDEPAFTFAAYRGDE